jgi:glycosidase
LIIWHAQKKPPIMKNKQQRVFHFLAALIVLGLISGLSACKPRKGKDEQVKIAASKVSHPEWSKNASIYEVNLRQYTPEGTFRAFEAHLDRLQDLGVDILWFMPITPIGELNRKGSLGSYYSVKDYTGINPEFGTLEDFKQLVEEIHARDMYVILDWVANHTAWDHPWTETNPEYYTRDEDGNFVPPADDWSDVIDLNYDNKDLWEAMIGEMRFWLEEAGVDGFRCDVADMVPTEFWNEAVNELEKIKPVFMLAEAEKPYLHEKAFEMGYGWSFHRLMNHLAQGRSDVTVLDKYFFSVTPEDRFPKGAYKMNFITNHDENSWAGTEFDRLGDGKEAFAVLTATMPGMILIYTGQEAGSKKMLEFFEKDEVEWGNYDYHGFYQTLLYLKGRNQALWNGTAGGDIQRVNTSRDEAVFAFLREKNSDRVMVVLNLSDEPAEVLLNGDYYAGTYTEVFSGDVKTFEGNETLSLDAWGYLVFEK